MTWEKLRLLHALDLLGQALEFDPYYASALGLAAVCHQNLHLNGWGEDQERETPAERRFCPPRASGCRR
jgi:adenylate cyclase